MQCLDVKVLAASCHTDMFRIARFLVFSVATELTLLRRIAGTSGASQDSGPCGSGIVEA